MDKYFAWELETLALLVCGFTEEEADKFIDEGHDLDDELIAKFEIDFNQFSVLLDKLIDFVPEVQTALTEERYRAFVYDGKMIARKKI